MAAAKEIVVLIALLAGMPAAASQYYVATNGDDRNPGTRERPFRHIQKCADIAVAGDTCRVREGTYRETVRPKHSGSPGRPIRFAACPGEVVVLDGTEPIDTRWSVYKGAIYAGKVDRRFEQLFADRKMMIEARWPNMRFEELWDRSRWARAAGGSRYGKMVDPELAKTGVDWTGALATLNVAHQFLTWTRPVSRHSAGSDSFEYSRDLPTITSYADKTTQWEDDRYYLSGKLEALDSPTEWFLDAATGTLYFWAPDGLTPAAHKLGAKARDYGFDTAGLDYIQLDGFHFFAATFRFEDSHHSTVENCHLLFPSYSREITELAARPRPSAITLVSGSHNAIRNSSLAYSSTGGFKIAGPNETVENNLVHDVSWNGSLTFVGIDTSGNGDGGQSLVRGNTVFRAGNAAIRFGGQRHVVEYNHAYDGGLACKDVALIYTGMPQIAGSIVRYNWAHGCRTEEGHGLGIRGDDQTRSLTVHHNVVWNAGRDGIIVKGDNNLVCNNTVLDIGAKDRPGNYISLHVEPEPLKPWREQFPLLKVQNAASLVFNNVARTITGDRTLTPFPAGENNTHNFTGEAPRLRDPGTLDFRPAGGSPLIDAGKAMPGVTDGYRGRAPDIGAYEYEGENWKPGYRNRLWVSAREVTLDGQGNARLEVALGMPPLEPVAVSITPRADSGLEVPAALTFTPEDWMRPKTVGIAGKGTRRQGSLRLEMSGCPPVEVVVRVSGRARM